MPFACLPAGRRYAIFAGRNYLNRDELSGGIVLFLFGAVSTLLSFRMPLGTFRNAGTGLFPLILGILLMFLSGLFLLRLFLQTQATREKLSTGESSYLLDLQRKGMQVVIPDADLFRAKAKPTVEELFKTEWSVTTWAEVLAQ
jgi:hypothetical protein